MRCELPQGWKKVRLEEVVDKIFSGGTPKTKEPSYWNGDYKWMSSGETRLNYIYNTEKTITMKGIRESATKEALQGDVVMASAGQGNTRGQTSLLCVDTFINQSIIALRANKNCLYNKFLFFNLRGRYPELRAISDSHSIRGSITTKMLKNFSITLPPLPEQKAIADTLSALDNKIELNKKINANLEAQAQAIFKHWFVDFEFPNENGNPYKSSGGEMVDSELGKIPKGWGVRKLGDKINISNGKRPNVKNEVESAECPYPILGASGIMGYTNNFLYVEPILVIGRVGTHGVVQKVDSRVWTSDNTMVIKSNYYEFVNIILENLDYKSLNRGSTQPLLTQIDIKNQKIVFPDELRTQTFETITGCFRKLIKSNQQQNQRLSQLRDTLLPKLMSGKIRIPLD